MYILGWCAKVAPHHNPTSNSTEMQVVPGIEVQSCCEGKTPRVWNRVLTRRLIKILDEVDTQVHK